MNAFGYRADQKVTDMIGQGRFTVSAEVIPPRNGAELSKVLSQIQTLVESGALFLSVTKGAGGSLRGGSLPIAQTVKERFQVPAIAHFTCRDLTPQEVENQLMDHHYFGVRNILALRGDPPSDQKDWESKMGAYNYAYELIQQIRNLNAGVYLARTGTGAQGPASQEKTDFCIGAAAYPEHPNEEERARFFRLKVEAGAEYGITQMLFDEEVYGRFLDLCEKENMSVPILPGFRVLKSKAQALRMAERFGVSVSETLLNGLPEQYDPSQKNRILDLFLGYMARLRSRGAPGVHLFVLSDTELAADVIKGV